MTYCSSSDSLTSFPPSPLLSSSGAEITAVVAAQGILFAFADVGVPVDVGGVLDLLLGYGKHDLFPIHPGSVDRREAVPGAKQTGLDQDPLRLFGLVVQVHLADLADSVAIGV